MLLRLYKRSWLYVARYTRKLTDVVTERYLHGDARPRYYDVDRDYPALRAIDRNYDAIKEELDAILPRIGDIPRYHEVDVSQTRISNHDDIGWRVFYVYMRKAKGIPNEGLCPKTYDVIASIPGVVGAFFSILEPGKCVPAHRGPFLSNLRYHTAFRVPTDDPPTIKVMGEPYTWKERESILFDDSLEHEVINHAKDVRVVLIVDIFRPLPWWLHQLNVFVAFATRQGIPDDKWEAALERRHIDRKKKPAPVAAG